MADRLRIASYNSDGFGDGKPEFIKNFLIDELKCDLILIQEHWLHKYQFWRIKNIDFSYDVWAKSGMPHNSFIAGRPFGGTAIMTKKTT